MSLIENALNKTGQEIREPVAQEGNAAHQSLKNILLLPARSKHNQAMSVKVALMVALSVVLLGGIAYVVVPKTDHPAALNHTVEKHPPIQPAPSPIALGDTDSALAQNDVLPLIESVPLEDTKTLPVMVVSPLDKKTDSPISNHEPESTVRATNRSAPAQNEIAEEQNRNERDRESGRISFLLKKAYLYGETGKYAHALQCYNEILARNPDHYDALLNRGIINQKSGYAEDAEKDLQQAFGLNSQDPILLNSLGVFYLNSGQIEEGRKLLLSAGTTTALINLARYYWGTGAWSRVYETLTDAQRLDAECPYTSYYLGLYYRERKDPERSRNYLDQAVKLARKRGLTEIMYAAEGSTGIKQPEKAAVSRHIQ